MIQWRLKKMNVLNYRKEWSEKLIKFPTIFFVYLIYFLFYGIIPQQELKVV